VSPKHPDIGGVLFKSFVQLFRLYSDAQVPPQFDVVITANLVLYSRRTGTYRLYFGQDAGDSGGKKSYYLENTYSVDYLSDVSKLPTKIAIEEIASTWDRIFSDTDAHVHEVASLVFIATKLMSNYASEKRGKAGSRWTRLW
jgi:hypothetical protein